MISHAWLRMANHGSAAAKGLASLPFHIQYSLKTNHYFPSRAVKKRNVSLVMVTVAALPWEGTGR